MGNVNFSADMVGIQTLAQQGKSPVQDGEAVAMGSFEDMIMQLVANNMVVLPEQNTEGVITEETEETQNIVLDAILNGMVSPEIQMQVVAEDNVLIVESVAEGIAIQNNPLNTIVQPQNIEAVVTTAVTGADVAIAQDSGSKETVFTDAVQTAVTEIAQNSADDVADTTKPVVDNNIQVDQELVRVDNETQKVESMPFAEKQHKDNELAGNQEAFVSTEDMLMMRAGNKINFSADRAMFKVAETPVNIASPTAVSDLADKILMKFTENEFEVELYPKNLGKITVSLTVEDGIVNVAMSSTNDKVNEFLASQSANIQSIVEKNTQYQAVIKLDDSHEQYQQQRDNAQHGADENQKNRQQEHLQQMYSQSMQQTTEDFLSMLRLV